MRLLPKHGAAAETQHLGRRRVGVDHFVTIETCTVNINSRAFYNLKFRAESADRFPRSHARRHNLLVRIDIVFLEAVDCYNAHKRCLPQRLQKWKCDDEQRPDHTPHVWLITSCARRLGFALDGQCCGFQSTRQCKAL